MAYSPLFEIAAFDSLPSQVRCGLVLQLVRAMVEIDVAWLLRHPEAPSLYASGVRYRPQGTAGGVVTGIDHWWDAAAVYLHGEGSCEDLAPIRVAELRVREGKKGVRPFVHSKDVVENGQTHQLYHVVVKYPNEAEEDPSLILGMWPPWS